MALQHLVPTPNLVSNMQPWLTIVPALLTGGLGYWWGSRGISGMKADLTTLQSDVQYLKGKFDGSQAVKPIVPVATPVTTPVVATPVPTTSG